MIQKIYVAGPLFNPKEREENAEIAAALEAEGFSTFLPQRDGFISAELKNELKAQGLTHAKAADLTHSIIVHLDVYLACEVCDGMVVNLNGRVPDEGAVAEAALALRSHKALVLYKNDIRTFVEGRDNSIVAGLTNFKMVNNINEIPTAFKNPNPNNELYYNTLMDKARQVFAGYVNRDGINLTELVATCQAHFKS